MIHLLLGFDGHWLVKILTQISAHWYSWQTWLIALDCSQKTFHFLSVANGPTSILSNISVTPRKSQETIFVGILKIHKYLREMFLKRLQDVTE